MPSADQICRVPTLRVYLSVFYNEIFHIVKLDARLEREVFNYIAGMGERNGTVERLIQKDLLFSRVFQTKLTTDMIIKFLRQIRIPA